MRGVASDAGRGWLYGGLDKSRYDPDHEGLRLGQAVLDLRAELADSVEGRVWANAYTDRAGSLTELGEAWLLWRPVPDGAWRWRGKLGAFFPELSLENHDSGWTPHYLPSSSAINTWVGEELRTLGGELQLERDGRHAASRHDWRFTVAAFRWNDPAGSLLAWRGWSVGERVTGLRESLPLPQDAGLFGADGVWSRQQPAVEPFHEIDHRSGWYAGLRHRYDRRLSVEWLRYDNRGDPERLRDHQYAWRTRFDHLAFSWQRGDWTLLGQLMDGDTRMGFVARRKLVDVHYRAAYLLLSRQLGSQRLHLRLDRFRLRDRDMVAADPNHETGHALALGWDWQWRPDTRLALEWLQQDSTRPLRELAGVPVDRRERQLTALWRWQF